MITSISKDEQFKHCPSKLRLQLPDNRILPRCYIKIEVCADMSTMSKAEVECLFLTDNDMEKSYIQVFRNDATTLKPHLNGDIENTQQVYIWQNINMKGPIVFLLLSQFSKFFSVKCR